MFGLFGKKEKETSLNEALVVSKRKEENSFSDKEQKESVIEKSVSIDVQIYNDVYSAQELLLQEARNILANSVSVTDEKYVLLRKMNLLGFANAEEVKSFKEYEDKIAIQTELEAKINYYKSIYPLNKFINRESVDALCEKYGLVLANVGSYIAEIPQKNQKEIVSFRVKKIDIRFPTETYTGRIARRINNIRLGSLGKSKNEFEMVEPRYLVIIAPKHKFDMTNLVQKGNVLLEIKDPIVLQPVNMGYLIVSSWGFEAGDELVVNSINN